jgi:hypothetical protein
MDKICVRQTSVIVMRIMDIEAETQILEDMH